MNVYAAGGLRGKEQAYDLLALAARERWGWETLPQLARLPGGKPYFPAFLERNFNLTHSGALALCALDDAPVGVDIQVVKQWRPGLPARTCSQRELAWLEAQGGNWEAFTLLWTMKEAWAKQDGSGLTRPIREISVPLPEAGERLLPWEGLWFRLWTGPEWAAAVCGLTPPPEDIRWRTL